MFFMSAPFNSSSQSVLNVLQVQSVGKNLISTYLTCFVIRQSVKSIKVLHYKLSITSISDFVLGVQVL